MSVRVTNNMLFNSSLADIMRQRVRLARVQEQASSGLRINHLADDPVGVRAATLLKAGLEATDQFSRNITQARSRVTEAEAALADTTEVMTRVRELAIQAANGSIDAVSRQNLAGEVEQLHARLLANANRRSSGGYIFSGYSADVQPFTVSGTFVAGSAPPTVSFTGDASQVEIEIDEGIRAKSTLNGQAVFMGDGDGDGSPDAGREDLFDILADLWNAMQTNDVTGIQDTLGRVDAAILQTSLQRTNVGAVDAQLTGFEERLELRKFDLTERLSDVQDADSLAVFSDLVNQETALQAALEASARMIQPSLMDFLN